MHDAVVAAFATTVFLGCKRLTGNAKLATLLGLPQGSFQGGSTTVEGKTRAR
jgi:hypothetical protein